MQTTRRDAALFDRDERSGGDPGALRHPGVTARTAAGSGAFLRRAVALAFATLLVGGPAAWASPNVYRCRIDGTVTFQRDPCPDARPRRDPTVEQLNAQERMRRRAAEAAAAPSADADRAAGPARLAPGATASRANTSASSLRCDGRRFCSQMTSCAEATYFLANCPGVEMDGDHDGVPCEQQWCPR